MGQLLSKNPLPTKISLLLYQHLYGAVSPSTGESFFWQFSHFDSDCYQKFLENLSQAHPNTLIILQVDNGRPHTAKKLKIPDNIILLFQPPYSPHLYQFRKYLRQIKHLK